MSDGSISDKMVSLTDGLIDWMIEGEDFFRK